MDNERELSLYVHIPFCSLKCSYCDFNSYAGLEDQVQPYVDALIAEIRRWSVPTQGCDVPTVFFGGGTPSLLPLSELERIVLALSNLYNLTPECEVSLEVNPGTVDRDYLRGLLALGVNRLSLGVQSFNDEELSALDRVHTAEEARQVYGWAREVGFQRLNLDLIYGLPRQQLSSWHSNVDEVVALEPDHVSLYALTVEDGTRLAYDVGAGRTPGPDDDVQAEMYEWSQKRLAGAGYDQYEISNWARPGQACRHNMTYWQNRSYLGLGCGAHSWFGGHRFADVYSPRQYIERMAEVASLLPAPCEPPEAVIRSMPQIAWSEHQADSQVIADTLILGLRLLEGVRIDSLYDRFDTSLVESYDERLGELRSLGLLDRAGSAVRLTQHGLLMGNEVFARLLPD